MNAKIQKAAISYLMDLLKEGSSSDYRAIGNFILKVLCEGRVGKKLSFLQDVSAALDENDLREAFNN